jgi:hypothetical protein
MVGNECEIIESFVRYNSNFIDKMYFIYDVGCVDGTIDILKKLQAEGFPIVLCDEALVSYEQRAIENKYMRIISENGADLIIPLDADEFLTSKVGIDLKCALDGLDLNRAYLISWKNYIRYKEDDDSERFIPKRIIHCETGWSNYNKVIIPAKLIKDYGVNLTTGHHNINSRKYVNKIHLDNIYIAHYPIISLEQYKSKIYCNCIRYITWMNRANGEGRHLNKLMNELENGNENFEYSVYSSEIKDGAGVEYNPLNTDCCSNSLEIIYKEESNVNFMSNIIKTGQVMALKAYNLEIEKKGRENIPNILVYGTGKGADNILRGVPEDLVNIVAYIDSDGEKKFTMFNKRIVVTPDMARLFPYDKIVISSSNYFDEMSKALLESGVSEDKIVGTEYLLDLMIGLL